MSTRDWSFRELNIATNHATAPICSIRSTLSLSIHTTPFRFQDPQNDYEALEIAIRENRPRDLDALLKHPKMDPSSRNQFAIREACAKGCTWIVKGLLLKARVDPSAEDNHAIRFAAAVVERVIQIISRSEIPPPRRMNLFEWLLSMDMHKQPRKGSKSRSICTGKWGFQAYESVNYLRDQSVD